MTETAKILFNKGMFLRQQGKHLSALEVFQKALEADPTYVDASYFIGNTLYSLQRYPEAITAFSHTVTLDPSHHCAYSNRALAYSELGKIEEELENYSLAIEANPTEALSAYNNRAVVRARRHNYNGALADYNSAIAYSNGRDIDAYYNRALLRWELKDFEGVLDDLECVLQLDPQHVNAYFNRARLHQEMGEYEKAIADYTKADQLHPNDPDVYLNRAVAYRKVGQLENALADINQAMGLKQTLGVYANLGYILMDLERYFEAIGALSKAIMLRPRNSTLLYHRGRCWAAIKVTHSAVQNFDRVLQINDKHAPSYYERGKIYYERMDYDQALADLKQCVQIAPSHVEAQDLLEKIETLMRQSSEDIE